MKMVLWKNRKWLIPVVLAVLALALMSANTTYAAPAEQTCGVYHTVQRGETMFSISRQYGRTIADLMRANPWIGNADRIYAGSSIYIPCGPGDIGTGGPCSAYHRVMWGETLGQLALRYRTPMYAIAQANGISNWNLIYAGRTLCIP